MQALQGAPALIHGAGPNSLATISVSNGRRQHGGRGHCKRALQHVSTFHVLDPRPQDGLPGKTPEYVAWDTQSVCHVARHGQVADLALLQTRDGRL